MTFKSPTPSNVSPEHLWQIEQRVLAMPMAKTLGLRYLELQAGQVVLEMPYADAFSFMPGALQATPVFAVADFAAVSAAATLLQPGWSTATSDTTLKLVAPAVGAALRARGRVISARKMQTVCAADVFAVGRDGEESLCATLLATAVHRAPPSQ
ncbi:aromatic catabolism protein [Hydrogenophaga crassostreae]|uniref:Aromatic catabolism protein n=1 Tax=Hydrogenophaga crassostreae TaxID=1763535 RepID=A0A167GEY2_9BURK|nr:aromatic catabolism protein [Hydrogenophaga crassostreae]AOW11520.1 aromatic catabolism protein [Hydrogenophaga crassostreae]OAD39359.1 aromatic catabolism protein [Hydrogenophaga crassostreae]